MAEPRLKQPQEQAPATAPVEWLASAAPVPYPEALAVMDARVDAIARGAARECVWLLEHPPLYTAGTSADRERAARRDAVSRVQDAAAAGASPITAPASAWLM